MAENERWLEHAATLSRAGEPFVLATVVAREAPQSARAGAHAIVHADGRVEGWVGGGCVRPTLVREALEALDDKRPRLLRLNPAASPDPRPDVRVYPMVCQGEGAVDVYLEPVLPAPVLAVLGSTPVAAALARLAPAIGLQAVALDPTAFPAGDGGLRQLRDRLEASCGGERQRFLVVATMGDGDEEALEASVADAAAAYIGLVASPKKAESLFAYLRARGVEATAIARVKAPAGLDLGAVTPDEIALSIAAEIVSLRRSARAESEAPRESAARLVESPAALGTQSPVPESTTDPVCGMAVDPATARHSVSLADGRTFHFCSPHCRDAFEREPERYLAATP